MSEAPVVVIGAGPQGLAAAAHLLERGVEPVVLEQGDRPAAAVAEWGHVRLFSEWSELVDAASARLLTPSGWVAPTAGRPTGSEWIASYLAPLAAALGERVRLGARVTRVTRDGDALLVHVAGAEPVPARAVLDVSGVWSGPAPAGSDGRPADGEAAAAAAGRVGYRIPDASDLAGRPGSRIVVVGSGHSAMAAVNGLADAARAHPGTRVTWVVRRDAGRLFGGEAADELVARGALGSRARTAVDEGVVELVTGFATVRFASTPGGVVLLAADGRTLPAADRVLVLTGFRPDLAPLAGLRLALDPVLEAPVGIAAEIDPALHSCGTVRPTGAADLAQPEPGLYLAGAKSYGRAPTFLALTGYEQVRSIAAALAGDAAGAATRDLVLPETGVCCAPAPELLQIGVRS